MTRDWQSEVVEWRETVITTLDEVETIFTDLQEQTREWETLDIERLDQLVESLDIFLECALRYSDQGSAYRCWVNASG